MADEGENTCFHNLYSCVEHQSYEFVDTSTIINKTIWQRPILHYQKSEQQNPYNELPLCIM